MKNHLICQFFSFIHNKEKIINGPSVMAFSQNSWFGFQVEHFFFFDDDDDDVINHLFPASNYNFLTTLNGIVP